ncbi:hypothetical protein EGJ22_21940 [Pseudomonas sp. p99-361]|nr:hypothetical protein [Pseudomonas sp. CAH-1]PPB15567.1 hypothetical protein HV87_12980 [Pseudomonas aeruginosa]QEQ86932.1 hypothetical protein F1602_06175 [Pseudomonas putida]RRV07725.1 hypothetical protein EGJ22_21940 [Pseudomonas sp. p99-361]
MGISWFDDWRFDMRGSTAFRQPWAGGSPRVRESPIIRILVNWRPCFPRAILVPISHLSTGLPA